MKWLGDRRNQMLVGGCVGAGLGGLFAHFASVELELVPVFAGFALGQIVAVLAGTAFRPDSSLERTGQSPCD
jgi:hypothetical protein